jgi:hypothetical protein
MDPPCANGERDTPQYASIEINVTFLVAKRRGVEFGRIITFAVDHDHAEFTRI